MERNARLVVLLMLAVSEAPGQKDFRVKDIADALSKESADHADHVQVLDAADQVLKARFGSSKGMDYKQLLPLVHLDLRRCLEEVRNKGQEQQLQEQAATAAGEIAAELERKAEQRATPLAKLPEEVMKQKELTEERIQDLQAKGKLTEAQQAELAGKISYLAVTNRTIEIYRQMGSVPGDPAAERETAARMRTHEGTLRRKAEMAQGQGAASRARCEATYEILTRLARRIELEEMERPWEALAGSGKAGGAAPTSAPASVPAGTAVAVPPAQDLMPPGEEMKQLKHKWSDLEALQKRQEELKEILSPKGTK